MSVITYNIVRHDDGWAYEVDGIFSDSFPTRAAARAAAKRAACKRRAAGKTAPNDYEDDQDNWNREVTQVNG